MIGAIIQARMGSSRLPGKVLTPLLNKPLLLHIVENLKKSKKIKKIVVATTNLSQDQEIEDFCKKNNIDCYRGSENNVLLRFIEAAKTFQITEIIRVCADSPLIDVASIDQMIDLKHQKKADLVTISPQDTSLLDGFEVTHLDFLQKLLDLATNDFHKEHVTYLAKENPALGVLAFYRPPKELCYTDIRITIDTNEDLEFMQRVFKWFQEHKITPDVRKIHKLPFYFFRINQNIKQKPANKKTIKVKIIANQQDEMLLDVQKALENLSYFKVEILSDSHLEIEEEALYLKRLF